MFQKNTHEPPDLGSIRHIAIIMDGNGRWAKAKGRPRVWGHKCGVESVRAVVEGAVEAGLQYLTLFAFSDENWQRPAPEVHSILGLLDAYLKKEAENLKKNNIRLNVIGDKSRLPEKTSQNIERVLEYLKDGQGLTLNVAVSYGSRSEIVHACQEFCRDVQNGVRSIEQLNSEVLSSYLWTQDIPDPDLLIRTSGEQRLSNFLLWQMAYTEFWFTQKHWPDFSKVDLFQAIEAFSMRDRRFGRVLDGSLIPTRGVEQHVKS